MPDAEKPAKSAERQYGVGHKLVGKDYPTPDLYAKVTGAAKYAEDFRAEGMLFCKLLLSPMPHARVKRIHASDALAMPGVRAILTADDLPAPADTLTDNGTVIKASKWGERGLTMEPLYQGELLSSIRWTHFAPAVPILAPMAMSGSDPPRRIRHSRRLRC
jgi:xanthine dehydrogenase molybdenum-binding subunit